MLKVIKVKEVLNFDGSLYKTKRVFATAADKTLIPMSMVYRKDLFDGKLQNANEKLTDHVSLDKPAAPIPTLLYGYGSYGICIDPGCGKLSTIYSILQRTNFSF